MTHLLPQATGAFAISADVVVASLKPPFEQFRTEADYNRFFVFTPESAEEEVAVAERFVAAARSLLDADPGA